ncbi:NnrS protein [compost metagenome]
MMAMMMRSTLGHSGRPLLAGPWELGAFLAVTAAAVVRVFCAMLVPAHYTQTVAISGLLWSAAFALFLLRFWPMLVRAREP